MKLEWNVYRYDINRNKIELWNVFNHWVFDEDVQKNLKKFNNKEEFAERLKSDLMYYFWSKAEYELVVQLNEDGKVTLIPWIGSREPEKAGIDVTNVLDFNWKDFAVLHISKQIFKNEAKIDIYEQVMFKWDEFLDYVWSNKKSKRTRKKADK